MFDLLHDKPFRTASQPATAAGQMHCDMLPVTSIFWPGVLLYRECRLRAVGKGVVPADEFLLGMVLKQLADRPDDSLACPISAGSLECSTTWERLRGLILSHAVLAKRTILEITGAHRLRDIQGFKTRLADARLIGCRVAIGEFGLGELSPPLLHALAIDMVKIDAGPLKLAGRKGTKRRLHHLAGFAACLAPIVVVKGLDRGAFFDLVAASGATHAQP